MLAFRSSSDTCVASAPAPCTSTAAAAPPDTVPWLTVKTAPMSSPFSISVRVAVSMSAVTGCCVSALMAVFSWPSTAVHVVWPDCTVTV